MCGIIAVVRRRSSRSAPTADHVVGLLDQAVGLLSGAPDASLEVLAAVADPLEACNRALSGVPGTLALVADRTMAARVAASVGAVRQRLAEIERSLDAGRPGLSPAELEALNQALIRVKDAAWSIDRDRLRSAAAVADLVGPHAGEAAVAAACSIETALSALDRLEVRGRDSAGVEVVVSDHQLDLDSPGVSAQVRRRADHRFTSGSVRVADGCLAFVYKAAAEVGELGDNTAVLRAAITSDELLHLALAAPSAQAVVLGHTRWASVGIISEPNAHPLDSLEFSSGTASPAVGSRPFVTGALNGDVDNFADLTATERLAIAPEITTDAKVIPTLVSRALAAGSDLGEAFRSTVARLEGSVAIGAHAASHPRRLLLAQRGSGQAIYVGVGEDLFVVASEPYGVVEETARYVRLDGETPGNAQNPTGSRGQIVELDGDLAGDLAGIRRMAYDGTPIPVTEADVQTAEITTRDIDRGDHPHFLLKEIGDAAGSFRKTLRGKLVEDGGRLEVVVGVETLPEVLRQELASGQVGSVIVIGQGTAAVAGQSLASALSSLCRNTPLRVQVMAATELSGFHLRPDMSDTLVVAISQSGTTTDTNRTVDLVRGRGARVVAVVNRRNSDLTDKADGVLFTSDGRDVEMSVASTKAFYAQIAAGQVLAHAIAANVAGARSIDHPDEQDFLAALRDLPERMEETLRRRAEVAATAQQLAPSRRYWAVVGNGDNAIAAQEVRIKLSELCYKSIACDVTEDKKHIDLSSEPLILVCAAGLSGSTSDDVAKEVAIYRAHKAAPIVIATDGQGRFSSALSVLYVPDTHPRLAFVLATMVGHLFGYEAALAIDAQALPLRLARAAIEQRVSSLLDAASLAHLDQELAPLAAQFSDGLRSREYDGHLEASSAVRLASLFRYATGAAPLDLYQVELGKVGTPGVVLEDLTAALTIAIEQLTRPVDAIKHQAKTVTVGISRSDESLLQTPLVAAVLAAGAPRDRLSYSTLTALAALGPAVVEVRGHTRYQVEGDPAAGATVVVVDRGGIAATFPSRADRDPRLRGTKALVARERELMVAKGRSDGRTVVIVPETKDNHTTGLTLLHLELVPRLTAGSARSALESYRRRYQSLKDAVTETEPVFRDDLLAEQPVVDLLTEPIYNLADRWRS